MFNTMIARQTPIIQLGNPTLRQIAQPIEDAADPAIQRLIETLLKAVKKSNGVGIAAPQLGASVRLFVIASRPNPRYPDAPEMAPIAMLNPRLISQSDATVKGWEGCLSVPGIRGLVPRSQAITVEYTDRAGTTHQQQLTGFIARIFLHELDHLDGKVFLDRVEATTELMSEQEFYARIVGQPQ